MWIISTKESSPHYVFSVLTEMSWDNHLSSILSAADGSVAKMRVRKSLEFDIPV